MHLTSRDLILVKLALESYIRLRRKENRQNERRLEKLDGKPDMQAEVRVHIGFTNGKIDNATRLLDNVISHMERKGVNADGN